MNRKLSLLVLIVFLATTAGCGGGDKALDTAGLNLGREATSLLGNLTQKLGSIQDLQSAQAALPDLQKFDGDLSSIVDKAKALSPESKNAFAGMVKGALPALESATARLSEMEGVGAAIMPTVDSILSKVRGLI